MDFLKSAVASALAQGPSFPYTFGDRVELDDSVWTLHDSTKKEDGSKCSVFSFDVGANRSRHALAKNAVRKLQTMRHPGILRVLDIVETETYIYVATERVVPLGWHVRRKSLSEEAAKWGLFTLAKTIKFVNDEGTSVHGNIRVSSIFTSESGEWKLAGLDVLSNMKEDNAIIFTHANDVPNLSRYVPPEVAKADWRVIKAAPLPAPDAYQYGLLIFEVFNAGQRGSDNPAQTKNVPPSMHQSYKRLLNGNPKARLSVSGFLDQGQRNGGFFETPLIRLSEGVDNLGLKTDQERTEFLSELEEQSDDFPEEFLKAKILPELLKSVEFGGGGPKVFRYILKIGSNLSDEEFEARLNPVIIRLFASPDRQMRVCLLDSLPAFIQHFSQSIVTKSIWPQVVTGFTDLAPIVREQTVKSVLVLVSKLSDRTINGDLLKYLAKTSMDEQPGIRTNTTICLGKISRSLGQSTRSKVLLNAFMKALGDPFVHARNASLQALAATADIFSDEECAHKLLPRLCSSIVDKEKIVRDQANKTFEIYLGRVRRYASTLPDTILPPPSQQGSQTTTPRMGTPANAGSSDGGWTGWAISSFTNKLAAASGEIQPRANGVTSVKSPPSRPASTPVIAGGMSKKPPTSVPGSSMMSPTASTQSVPSFGGQVEIDDQDDFGDAWGEMNDDEQDYHDHDTNGPERASNPAAFWNTSTGPSAGSSNPFDDGGEPDFAGWLSAQKAAKSKAPLPKGLARKTLGGLTATTAASTRPTATRASSTGNVSSGSGVKKAGITASAVTRTPQQAIPSKAIDTKPKDDGDEDDGWGDAWD